MTERPASLPDLWVLTHAPGYAMRDAQQMFERLDVPQHRRVLVTMGPARTPMFPCHLVHVPQVESLPGDWWTAGLEWIASHYVSEHDIWDVLMVETSVVMTPEDADVLRDHMRILDCSMAGADNDRTLSDASYQIVRDADSETYMPRGAFVVSGELGVRHDPSLSGIMQQYDFELRHRRIGGAVLVGGTRSFHAGGILPPGSSVREVISTSCVIHPSYREKIL